MDRRSRRVLAFFVYLGLRPDEVADELARLGVERTLALDTVLAAVREDQEGAVEFAHAVIEHQHALDAEWPFD